MSTAVVFKRKMAKVHAVYVTQTNAAMKTVQFAISLTLYETADVLLPNNILQIAKVQQVKVLFIQLKG